MEDFGMKDYFSLASDGLNEEEEYKPQSTRTSADDWRKKRNAKEIDAIVRVCDSPRLSAVKILEKEYRKMKKAIVFLTVFFLAAMCYAQQVVVMIPPFTLVEGVSRTEADTITRLFLGRLSATGTVTIINTANLQQRMAAMKWEQSDWSSNEKKAKLNEGFNAEYLIIGTISNLFGDTIIDITAENMNTFVVVGSADTTLQRGTSPNEKINELVTGIVRTMTGGSGGGARPVGGIQRSGTVPAGFVRIEGGTFTMGSPSSEVNRGDDEAQHQVTVSGFYMGKCEVTQAEYEAVMGTNPSNFKGSNLPVEQVSWYDAIDYCNKRSVKEGLSPAYTRNGESVTWNKSANGYRLPTEAEWEYACRAGTTTPFSTGSNITTAQANYDGNFPYNNNSKGTYREKTTGVGSFSSNPWGLYDMHGNVYEWCWDWYGGYSMVSQSNPDGAVSGADRVSRGGSWYILGQSLRSAGRNYYTPSYRLSDLGFRLVRP